MTYDNVGMLYDIVLFESFVYCFIYIGSMGSGDSNSPTGSYNSNHQHYESDSSRYSMSSNYDTQSINSAGSNSSPPAGHRRISHPPQTGKKYPSTKATS